MDPKDRITSAPTEVTLRDAFWVWFRIGWLGFGGPAGQIALMHRELVERRQWISEHRFLHALSYCMLLPGPEAQQLSVYIGWLMHRTLGGIMAGVLFVLPGALVLGLLSALYVVFGQTTVMSSIFFGLKAAVLALVIEAVIRIGKRALKTRVHWLLAASAFVAIFLLAVPFPWIVLVAAIAGVAIARWAPHWLPAINVRETDQDGHYVVDRLLNQPERQVPPSGWRSVKIGLVCLALWFVPLFGLSYWLGQQHIVVQEGWFFSQTALVTFGGAYAVLAYVTQHAVGQLGWLQPAEMVDGLALAESTPGPLIMVLQFVGFVAAFRNPGPLEPWSAALLGASITTWVTFVPCFLFVLVGAPYIESLRRHAPTNAALSCITAAVVGVVLSLCLWFGLHTLFATTEDWRWGLLHITLPHWRSVHLAALVLALLSTVALFRFKLGLGWVLAGSALFGLAHSVL